MNSRLGIAVAICLCIAAGAKAQVVRFETTMGDFDMVLNPTNNPLLQNHVDNMLNYVERETYAGTWINRAPAGFVLQMGGFYSQTLLPQFSIEQVRNIRGLSPIEGHPAGDNPPLSNTVGTVSLALSGNPANPNSGSNSFFINLSNENKFLDPQFTVFAAIPDMAVVNKIMALSTIDQTSNPNFPDQTGNAGLEDIPVQADGNLVFIKRVFVVTDNLETAKAIAGVQSVMAQSAQSFADTANSMDSIMPSPAAGLSTSTSARLSTNVVPEPASLSLLLGSLFSLGLFRRRHR